MGDEPNLCERNAFWAPFPGGGRPWVGNPARCGKRSRDGGCQATLIQSLTNFQQLASAAEPNQQMIKHQIHTKPIVSICPFVGGVYFWPYAQIALQRKTWVPCGSTPKAVPKKATVPSTDLQGRI